MRKMTPSRWTNADRNGQEHEQAEDMSENMCPHVPKIRWFFRLSFKTIRAYPILKETHVESKSSGCNL